MIAEVFNLLYQCAFKEHIAKDMAKAQKAGESAEQTTDRIYNIYGEDLSRLDEDQLNTLAESVNNDGAKYLFRERNRLEIVEFMKRLGL